MVEPASQRWGREQLEAAAAAVRSWARNLRPTPRVVAVIFVLTPLAMLVASPLGTGPIEITTQGGTRSLRDPGAAMIIAPPTTAVVEEQPEEEEEEVEEGSEPPPVLAVDSRTFLTSYEDSVVLQNLPSLCDAPPPGDAIYVANGGDDNGPGTVDQPMATINRAISRVQAGQTILVRGGDYWQTATFAQKYGTPDAYITLRAYPGEQVRLIADVGEDTIRFRRGNAFINIACFEMAGPGDRPEARPSSPEEMRSRILSGQAGPERTPQNYGAGVDIGDRSDTRAGYPLNHHIRVIGNVIHGYAEAGVSALETNHVSIIGNRTYRNALHGCHSGSGISLAYLVDGGGPDNNDGYSNYVVGNVSYENENISLQCFSDTLGPVITDGNGIIMDQNDLSGTYFSRTLIADNVVFDNGGRGILVFESSRVDVVNNLSYNNVLTPNLLGRDGPHPEIAVADASDVRVYNNISLPRPGHVAYENKRADVDERSNLFAEPGQAGQYFDPTILEQERRFVPLVDEEPTPEQGTGFSGELPEDLGGEDGAVPADDAVPDLPAPAGLGTPYLATPARDGSPVLIDPVPIGPIYNFG